MHGNKVVLDLEFTPVTHPDLQDTAGNEIIEIGAVKLGTHNELIEEFQTYVKPKYSCILPRITRITNITNETVEFAPDFETATRAFTEWIGETKKTQFYTWSGADQPVIQREAEMKEFPLHPMFYTHWIDLQRIHQRLYRFQKPMNLTVALGSMQIYFEGLEHGALADARNTAKILHTLSDVKGTICQRHGARISYNNPCEYGILMEFVFRKKSTSRK